MIQESVVRIGARLPFDEAVEEVQFFRHTALSRSTVRRLTLAAGSSQVELQERALSDEGLCAEGSARQLVQYHERCLA